MAKVVGDIAVQVGADVSGLERGMSRASRSINNFDNSAAAMAKRFAKVGVAVAAAAAAMGAGIARAAGSAAQAATDIQNLSRIAGVSAEEFQKLAAAAETVGFSQEKVADVFKDVNDKFGDFMATGAGPLRDFFEQIAPQVGVTADQFARLSGPEALQLYVDSLERAGVSQQQMTFYMEALANDATALIPLLRDNGSEMKRLGDEADRAGRVIGNDLVNDGAALDRKLDELSETIRQQFNAAILENAEEIKELARVFSEVLIPVAATVASAIAKVAAAIAGMTEKIMGAVRAHAEWKKSVRESGADMTPGPPGSFVDQTGFELDDPRGDDVLSGRVNPYSTPGSNQLTTSLLRSPQSDDPLAGLQDYLATKKEVVEEAQAEELAGAARHAEQLAAIESASLDDRLSAYQGAFGDLAGLMRTENDKLFKIGQAASIAQATIEGYSAAVSAWDKGMKIGGPPLAAAFTAASLAKTGALIASIASASPRGGGGAPGAAAGATAAQVPNVSRNVVVELQGEVFGRSQITSLINQLNEAVEDGAILRLA